jgi:hypothetical protein
MIEQMNNHREIGDEYEFNHREIGAEEMSKMTDDWDTCFMLDIRTPQWDWGA